MRINRSFFEQLRFVLGTFLACGSILFFSHLPARARALVEDSLKSQPVVAVTNTSTEPVTEVQAGGDFCEDPTRLEQVGSVLTTEDFLTPAQLASRLPTAISVATTDLGVSCVDEIAEMRASPEINETLQNLASIAR